MNFQVRPRLTTAERQLPFECIALVLQGGGALRAYQGGVYEALAEANIHPDWIAGISIGAINGAIIAGNPPKNRVDRLREFWAQVTSSAPWHSPILSDSTRNLLNQMNANFAASCGAQGFFAARLVTPWLQPSGTLEATSFYDTKALKNTLERLVDFDRLNAGMTRFSAGAVNIRTGNFVYFDNSTHTIGPEHIMASGDCRPVSRRSRLKASNIGTVAWSRTRPCNGWWTSSPAATPWPSRSTCGTHTAISRAISWT